MMAAIRRLLGLKPAQTFWESEPAPRDPIIEARIKEAQTELVKDVMQVERQRSRVRQDLAAGVIEILQGER